MIEPKFNSIIASYLKTFLNECSITHRSLGQITNIMNLFDKFLCSENVSTVEISEETFEKWVDSFQEINCYKRAYIKRSYTILLLEYMASLGVKCVVPRRAVYKNPTTFIPYIFSHDEITHMFEVSDGWRDKCMKPQGAAMAMPVVLRLLYSTGLRISEVINIRNRDIDFKNQTIRIRCTKNGMERLAPINESMETVVIQYLKYRNRLPSKGLDNPDGYLIVNHRGRKLTKETLLARFHRITDKAGIVGNNPKTGCRIHDLRHTACVHVMCKLLTAGYDLYDCIPIISAFMGHKSVYSTEQYLRLTSELYPDLLKMGDVASGPIKDIINHAINIKEDE